MQQAEKQACFLFILSTALLLENLIPIFESFAFWAVAFADTGVVSFNRLIFYQPLDGEEILRLRVIFLSKLCDDHQLR